ncbi:MAG: hypothetical protein KDK27_20990, partial [Leptospiraceae bacterium]|nr:hypothetical protein [Leptospiraceae bacterium]
MNAYIEKAHTREYESVSHACRNIKSPSYSSCPIYARPLIRSYNTIFEKVNLALGDNDEEGNSIREEWRSMLRRQILYSGDRPINSFMQWQADMETQGPNIISSRPISIFNASHNVELQLLDPLLGNNLFRGFPFEITMSSIGTSYHFNNRNSFGFSFVFSHHLDRRLTGIHYFHSTGSQEPLMLSHVAAMSSAVVPDLRFEPFGISLLNISGLEWYYRFPISSRQSPEFVLTDGGHSEDLGAIALMERGVKFIVVSDAGRDDD